MKPILKRDAWKANPFLEINCLPLFWAISTWNIFKKDDIEYIPESIFSGNLVVTIASERGTYKAPVLERSPNITLHFSTVWSGIYNAVSFNWLVDQQPTFNFYGNWYHENSCCLFHNNSNVILNNSLPDVCSNPIFFNILNFILWITLKVIGWVN